MTNGPAARDDYLRTSFMASDPLALCVPKDEWVGVHASGSLHVGQNPHHLLIKQQSVVTLIKDAAWVITEREFIAYWPQSTQSHRYYLHLQQACEAGLLGPTYRQGSSFGKTQVT